MVQGFHPFSNYGQLILMRLTNKRWEEDKSTANINVNVEDENKNGKISYNS